MATGIGLFVGAVTSDGDWGSTAWGLSSSGVLAVMSWGMSFGAVLGLLAGVCAGGVTGALLATTRPEVAALCGGLAGLAVIALIMFFALGPVVGTGLMVVVVAVGATPLFATVRRAVRDQADQAAPAA